MTGIIWYKGVNAALFGKTWRKYKNIHMMVVIDILNIRGRSIGRRCFTLVEMMVVIAIMALLLMIFLPVLVSVKGKAREVACKNNLKQIGLAMAAYPDENSGYAMPCIFEVQLEGENKCYSWLDYLYNKSAIPAETAKCPSMNDEECFDPWGGNDIFQKYIRFSSYTMNVIEQDSWGGAEIGTDPLKATGWGLNSSRPINLKSVGDLSDKICLTDVLKKEPGFVFTSKDATMIVHYFETDHGMFPLGTGTERRDVGNHHSGGFNALFGDGHVETLINSKPRQWVVFGK